MAKHSSRAIELFWQKVNKDGPVSTLRPDLGKCWIWKGYITKLTGYGWCGYMGEPGKNEQIRTTAHRFAYELLVGDVPPKWHVDHLCMVRACCNPEHLEAVTHGENLRRASVIRGKSSHCKNGHEMTPQNTYQTTRQRWCRQCVRDNGARYRKRKKAASGLQGVLG